MRRHRLGKAFIHPATTVQRSFDSACTGPEVVLPEVVHQDVRAPTFFKVAIRTWALRDHVFQYREGRLFLPVGAPRWRSVFESLNATLHIGFEPAADRVCMAAGGLGNGGNTLAAIRSQDNQAAFGEIRGADAARFFQGLPLRGRQLYADHRLSFQRMASGVVLDQLGCHECTDPKTFLQSFSSGRLLEVGKRRALRVRPRIPDDPAQAECHGQQDPDRRGHRPDGQPRRVGEGVWLF